MDVDLKMTMRDGAFLPFKDPLNVFDPRRKPLFSSFSTINGDEAVDFDIVQFTNSWHTVSISGKKKKPRIIKDLQLYCQKEFQIVTNLADFEGQTPEQNNVIEAEINVVYIYLHS